MHYVALLRGINVGGNSMIKMTDLKTAFQKCGYENVSTYINSGNVIFESSEKNNNKITEMLRVTLSKIFHYDASLVVLSKKQLQEVVIHVPNEWKIENDLRCYIAFVKVGTHPSQVLKEIVVKEGIDFVKVGEHALYLSTHMSGLTKSGFTKLIGKKIYKEITMRNYTTVQKLLILVEK